MKLYVISQTINDGWDTYDSAVVCAESEEEARLIHPSELPDDGWPDKVSSITTWALPKDVSVEYIGEAKEDLVKGVVVASFNAG